MTDTRDRTDEQETPRESNLVGITQEAYGDDKPYQVRKLRDGDTYRVGAMVSKILGDPGIRYAAAEGDQNMIMMAFVGALFDKVPRELQLLLADLIGITKDLREYKHRDDLRQQEEVKERQRWQQRKDEAQKRGDDFDELAPLITQLKSTDELKSDMEDDILEEMDEMPPGTSQDILAEVISRDDFVPFITSSQRLYEAGKGLFGRFGTHS